MTGSLETPSCTQRQHNVSIKSPLNFSLIRLCGDDEILRKRGSKHVLVRSSLFLRINRKSTSLFEKQRSQHCVLPYRFLSHPGSMYYSPSRLVSCLVINAVLNAIRLSYDWRQGLHLQGGWRHHLYHNNQLMCNLSICVCVFPFFCVVRWRPSSTR